MSDLHDKYVTVPAEKALNSIVFVCKRHYIDCLINELGIENSLGNLTYTPTTIPKEDILLNHKSVMSSVAFVSTKKTVNFQNFTGFRNCINVHINNGLSLGLPSVPPSPFLNY